MQKEEPGKTSAKGKLTAASFWVQSSRSFWCWPLGLELKPKDTETFSISCHTTTVQRSCRKRCGADANRH